MIVTGYTSVASAQEAAELGVVDYLVKPFGDMDELKARIAAGLASSPRPAPSAATRRVDVFEDDAASARSIVEALALLGLEGRVLAGRVEQVSELPHAVVVSWELASAPGPEGLQLARGLGVPFIVLARDLSFDVAIAALRGGAAACLPKLLGDVKALARQIDRALGSARR